MVTYKKFYAEEINDIIEELGRLRIEIFREFPYLYDGNLDYEKEYLKTYSKASSSMILVVFDQNQIIGASSCLKLIEETPEVILPFIKANFDLNSIVYFGESLLKSSYRGQGIGKVFFEEREKHALTFQEITTACFCAVKREHDHPLKPHEYIPLDNFWNQRNYSKQASLISEFEWKDTNENQPSIKIMEYWTKQLRNQ
jgi:hypothetical protein